MIKGVIFDMDGVLVDNRDVHMEAFDLFARRHGVVLKREAIDRLFGRGNDEIMPAICPQEIIEREGMHVLSAEKEAIYREIYKSHVVPVEGLVELLGQLRKSGIRCAVGSSGSKDNVDFVVGECRIEPYFDALIDGGMVEKRKPAPDIFLYAAKMLDIPPTECVVFEDSISGITAAQRAGMKVVGVATTMTREKIVAQITPDAIIDNFTQIDPEGLQKL